MKKFMILITIALAFAASATTKAEKVLSTENLTVLQSTNACDWAAQLAIMQELVKAHISDLEKSENGRQKLHGRLVNTRVDFEKLKAVNTYADGHTNSIQFAFADPNKVVEKYNAKLPASPTTNGVPTKLAEARRKRHAEKLRGTVESTVIINATKGVRP